MQLMITRTEMTVTPRMASRIVPAGGLSKGGVLVFEGCVDDSAGVCEGDVVTIEPSPACDIGTHELI